MQNNIYILGKIRNENLSIILVGFEDYCPFTVEANGSAQFEKTVWRSRHLTRWAPIELFKHKLTCQGGRLIRSYVVAKLLLSRAAWEEKYLISKYILLIYVMNLASCPTQMNKKLLSGQWSLLPWILFHTEEKCVGVACGVSQNFTILKKIHWTIARY